MEMIRSMHIASWLPAKSDFKYQNSRITEFISNSQICLHERTCLLGWVAFGLELVWTEASLERLPPSAHLVAPRGTMLVTGSVPCALLVLHPSCLLSSLLASPALLPLYCAGLLRCRRVDVLAVGQARGATTRTSLLLVGEAASRGSASWRPQPADWACEAAAHSVFSLLTVLTPPSVASFKFKLLLEAWPGCDPGLSAVAGHSPWPTSSSPRLG